MELSFEVDVYSKKSLFDYKDEIPCNLKKDEEINTDEVRVVDVVTHCVDDDKKRYIVTVSYNVVDKEPPIIYLKNVYTVEEGYTKKLTDVIISADNYDKSPKREIIGEYDFNKIGNYNLVYKVTDSSGNETSKDFILSVIKKQKTNNNNNNSFIAFSNVVRDYKKDDALIGIDVSKWQGKIDFEKVKEAGCEFVMIRIGYQDGFDGESIMDPYFEQNIKNASDVGLKIGVYYYSYAKSFDESLKQAEWIIEKLNGRKLDLPITFDWESWSSFNSINMNLHDFNKMADIFMEKAIEKGYEGMLYSSKNYLENIWYEQKYKTWLAHYTYKTTYEGKYYMWQMCSDGRIDGIDGDVDIDVLYLN